MGRISGNVIGDLGRVLRWGTATGDDDDRLLERFLVNHDESAFTALVARHGPMVLGVCRRVLRDEHDVEDAFQATFLVLVRSAGAIRRGELVGPWIHGVAHRIAVRARAGAARRFVRERSGSDVESLALTPAARDHEHAELRTILDAELARLPETLRAPLVLCYLEGMTHEQAAGRLRQPVGTIRSRLSRGRERLRNRLARRGVSADDAAWGSIVLAEPVSPVLFETTVRSALEFAVYHNTATALVSATTAALAKGVLDAMLISKLKLAGACALGLVLTMGGMSGYALQHAPGEEAKAKEAPETVVKSPETAPAGEIDKKQVERLLQYLASLKYQKDRKSAEVSTLEEQINQISKKLADARRSPPIETPQDSLKPRVASEMRELRAAIDESELELTGLKHKKEELEKRIAVAESVVARHRKMLSNLFQNAINPQTAPAQKPAEDQKADGAKQPEYLDPDQPIVVPSERGHVVTIFGLLDQRAMSGMGGMGGIGGGMMPGMMGGRAAMGGMMGGGMGGMMGSGDASPYAKPQSLRLAEEGDPGLEVTASTNQYSIPLSLRGEKIQRLAVFNKMLGRWDVEELRDPVKEASPVSSQFMTVYALGRRLYTYSVRAGRWSVLELPEGATPEGVANDRGLTLKYGEKVHIYNVLSGEWTDFDLRVSPKESKKAG